jgi:hypothetical protein
VTTRSAARAQESSSAWEASSVCRPVNDNMSSNSSIPLLPSSSHSSPQKMTTIHKLPKFTYGRHQPSSPSEADRSLATLFDADLSPFAKLDDEEDIAVREVQSSISSQETRVGDDDDDDEDPHRNGESAWKHNLQESSDQKSNQSHARLRTTLNIDTDFAASRHSHSKGINSAHDPESEESANDGPSSPGGFQFSWRQELKKIDDDYAKVDFPSKTGPSVIPDPLPAESPPCLAESSQQRHRTSLTARTTRLTDADNSSSDTGSSSYSQSPSKSKTRATRSMHMVEQNEEAGSMSDIVDKRRLRARASREKEKSSRPKTKVWLFVHLVRCKDDRHKP